MTTAPEPRYSGNSEGYETYEDVLAEVFEHTNLSLEERCAFLRKMGLAVGYEVADELQKTHEFLNDPAQVALPSHLSRAEREAALHRRKVLVHLLLIAAVSTMLTSMYAMGLGHDAFGWFGCAGALGLAYMAHQAEAGR